MKRLLPLLFLAGCVSTPQGPSLREQADGAFTEVFNRCKEQYTTYVRRADCVQPTREAALYAYGWNRSQVDRRVVLMRVVSAKLDKGEMTPDEAKLIYMDDYDKVQNQIDAEQAQRDAAAHAYLNQAIGNILGGSRN
ncbi:MAG: hypothetical protein ACRBBW_20560 [Cellvibrionaceae bacterium]